MKTARAVFQADGKPDTVVAIVMEDSGTEFAIHFGEDKQIASIRSGIVPLGATLQLAEALQYVADTVSSTVPGRLSPFVRGWQNAAADVHHTAREKGFWEDGVERNNGEMLCLIHSELSEALEALRKNDPPDNKIPEFTSVETELADAVIRIMDLAHARGWRVAQAIEAKMKFNSGRPYKHGKEF